MRQANILNTLRYAVGLGLNLAGVSVVKGIGLGVNWWCNLYNSLVNIYIEIKLSFAFLVLLKDSLQIWHL
jgi:hypothetical protein